MFANIGAVRVSKKDNAENLCVVKKSTQIALLIALDEWLRQRLLTFVTPIQTSFVPMFLPKVADYPSQLYEHLLANVKKSKEKDK